MSRVFPHLADTAFPNLDSVDPYKRETTFDYGRYDYTASAKLCNVTWTPDYSHVIGWKSAQQRDAYFEAIAGPVVELQQGFVHTQLDTIAVSVPYDVALTYSYVYLRVPVLTEDTPIDYETADGMRTVCAFVSEVVYNAPSTTTLVLDVDYWTTYLPHLSVSSLMLERGHAPMYATDVDTYFSDPIAHCANLLTPDVSYADPDVVRGGSYKPLSEAMPVYIFASTIPYSRITRIPLATNATQTGPTYSNTGARNGEQVQVNNFVWSPIGKSYAGMSSPSVVTFSESGIPTGLYYYGLRGEQIASGALQTLTNELPVFITSIKATYIVPEDLITVKSTIEVAGVGLLRLARREGLQKLGSIEITRDLFDVPAKYQDIAKLYTFPYASLELSDDCGNALTIHVEETHGTLDISQLVCILWPALSWEVMITNVASTSKNVRYEWVNLSGVKLLRELPGAEFANAIIDIGIPTYALYLSAVVEDMLSKQRDAEQARKDAIIGYQSTMRSANTAEHNAYDGNATARSNAYSSADTGKANADASADTAKANTTTSTNNMRTNAARSNSYRSTAEQNARTYSTDTASTDLTFMQSTTMASVNQQQAAAISQVSNIVSGGIGSVAGNLLADNIPGAVMAGAGALSGALNAGAAYAVTLTTEVGVAGAASAALYDKAAAAAALSYVNANNANAENTEITGNNATTADTIASASQTTSKANATRSQTTSKANALASESTGNANANYTRDTTEENAKAQLESAQTRFASQVNHSAVLPPVAHGEYTGDYSHEQLQSRGLHLRAKTQNDAALARAGDTFRRYGYAYNGMWTVTDWVPNGKRYCYWQSGDIMQNVRKSPNVAANRNLHVLLREGVTIWADPNDVGRW